MQLTSVSLVFCSQKREWGAGREQKKACRTLLATFLFVLFVPKTSFCSAINSAFGREHDSGCSRPALSPPRHAAEEAKHDVDRCAPPLPPFCTTTFFLVFFSSWRCLSSRRLQRNARLGSPFFQHNPKPRTKQRSPEGAGDEQNYNRANLITASLA